MLVLSRKSQEAVIVGAAADFEHVLKVTVLEINGRTVKLGFEINKDVPILRWELWEKKHPGGQPDGPAPKPGDAA